MLKKAIMIADGCEEIEALTVVDLLRRADLAIDMVSIKEEKGVTGSHGIRFETDFACSEFDPEQYDAVILPGGLPGTTYLGESGMVTGAVKDFFGKGKLVAAICAAPTVLAAAGVLQGRRATCYPAQTGKLTGAVLTGGSVVRDGNLITSRGMGTAIDFALAIIAYYKGQEAADAMAEKIVYRADESC